MIKVAQPFLISLVALLVTVQPIYALSILVGEDGTMSFNQGQVLGDDSEDEVKNKEKDESPKQRQERSKENDEQRREQPKQKIEDKVIKTVLPQEKKQLKVIHTQQNAEIIIEGKKLGFPNKGRFTNHEKIETKKFEIKLPANPKPSSQDLDDDEIEDEDEIDEEIEDDDEKEDEDEIDDEREKVKLERQKRKDMVKLKTQSRDDGTQEIEIEAGDSKATFKAAEFVVDPVTKNVTITTPSGKSHTLLHLPDQALQRMKDAGLLPIGSTSAQSELTVETKDDGSVVYKTKTKNIRRLFGLLPFEVEDEIELNDSDSQVTTQPTDSSFIGKLLFSLSR